jgi:hypothetical protein
LKTKRPLSTEGGRFSYFCGACAKTDISFYYKIYGQWIIIPKFEAIFNELLTQI